ncbi:MAG TPA: bifunctional glutamate N-acetyltransferase/amino-acid acetyltransferase ArgJ [Lachnospiraceae bacterium]|nr:bifunctional glutamate N-acetyltransferase/amino-acid acetyltransferase ArgJ [Lachnospiraceae bacterium]
MNYQIINGGVTAAKGFQATGTEAGIKYANRKDMAMIYSEEPCVAAATFTTNVVKAAPVLWDKQIVDNAPFLQAVVVNAGIANAGTGQQGMEICEATAKKAADVLHIPANAVAVGSTGVIGMQVPVDKIKAGIEKMVPKLGGTLEDGLIAAQSIMTTDTISKEAAVTFEIGGKTVTLGGMCKGSGMIHPNMCTMLGYLTTDLNISKELLAKALKEDVQDTFNMITVDGDTSTNDTLLILANGLAGNPEITSENEDYAIFKEALNYVNQTLAKMMAGDGEGATALIEVKVINADTKENAKLLSKSVVGSSLTKAAIYGHDSNWGRILCALGYSGAQFNPNIVDIAYEGNGKKIQVCQKSMMVDYSEAEATEILSSPEVTILVNMNAGTASATAWGCDLTYDYVKINADYRS